MVCTSWCRCENYLWKRAASPAQHVRLRTVSGCDLEAAVATWEGAEWKAQPTPFGLLVQCPSQDTVPSCNVLDSDYYDNQHNCPLRAHLECGILS